MKHRIVGTLAVIASLAVIGCGEGAQAEGQAESTDATTSTLLSAQGVGISEMSTGSLPPGSPRVAAPRQSIDVASLGVDHGSADAPIRVVEMSDYGCGYCRRFFMETWPVLQEQFIATGKVEWKFLPFVNGMFQNSPAAIEAAECVLEQSRELFEPMNHRVWEGQGEWKNANEPEPILRGWAAEVGADMSTFDSCISEGRRQPRVAAAGALSRQAGVRGTPTFFVVGYPPLQGALPTETFTQVLDMVYADATSGGR